MALIYLQVDSWNLASQYHDVLLEIKRGGTTFGTCGTDGHHC